ncbi:hypothetical protein AeRB84_010153 [Aphanomyces euteiches]|nr:hypothetical protein AeRB84_010153 [Aphanomyces euteiches]
MWTTLNANPTGSRAILDFVKPGKTIFPLCSVLSSECLEKGIEPTLSNFAQYNIPYPISIHQILRVVNHEHIFTFSRVPHARLVARKKSKLLKALYEYSLVAQGTCVLAHLNDQAPSKSFVRVERPQERYFLIGEDFENVASFLQDKIDKPRDATKLLLSLELLPQRNLVQFTRKLVAEAQQASIADWVNRPSWLQSGVFWTDPLQMNKTDLLRLCHACLERIYSPNICGPIEIRDGRIISAAD